MAIAVIALGWGALVLAGSRGLVRRVGVSERARRLRRADGGARSASSHGAGSRFGRTVRAMDARFGRPSVLAPVDRVARGLARRRTARRRDELLARELPAAIDLLAVAVSAGSTPFAAIEIAVRWAPHTIGSAFDSVLMTCRLGGSLEPALRAAATRDPRLEPLATVIATGSRLGAGVNDALARLAAESRRDLRRRAEARARTVPVRLLFPLVFLVLPAFGLLTVVPAVAVGFRGL